MTRLPEIANPTRLPYASDLSDAQWEILKPLLPQPKGFGHPEEGASFLPASPATICNALQFPSTRLSSPARWV